MTQQRQIGFLPPPLRLPCGEEMQISLEHISVLRGAGVEEIHIEKCYRCEEEHAVPLPDCRTLTARIVNTSPLQVVESHPQLSKLRG